MNASCRTGFPTPRAGSRTITERNENMDNDFIPPKQPLVQVMVLVDFDNTTDFVERINENLRIIQNNHCVVRSVRFFDIHHCVIEYEVVTKGK